jgi:transmembrane sensor
MTSPPSSPSSLEIDESASLWAARLDDGDLSEAHCTELDSWLQADSRHREALASYGQLSAWLEQRVPALAATGSIKASSSAAPSALPPKRGRPRWWLVGGALAAAASVAVVISLQTAEQPSPQRVATSIAQRQSLTLADGSQVDLNAHTSLVVVDTPAERRVRLAGGQAFFKITKNPNRPFIVDTPAGAIRVTGTAFDVRQSSSGYIEVTVQEGSVQVRLGPNEDQSDSPPFSLVAGDQLESGAKAPVLRKLTPEQIADSLAWRDGQAVFDATPLQDAVAQFAHYHGRGISTTSEVAQLQISGRFPLDDLEGFLAGLEEVLPVKVNHGLSGTSRIDRRQ